MKKNERGITLIALVITVIVLLILAGVSISMIVGENGALKKAVNAKQNMKRAEVIEQARLDVSDKQVYNLDSKLKKSELIEVLNHYFENVPENSDDILSETVIAKQEYGGYSIKVNEIYNNGFLDEGGDELPPENSSTLPDGVDFSLSADVNHASLGEEVRLKWTLDHHGSEIFDATVRLTIPDGLELVAYYGGGTYLEEEHVITWDIHRLLTRGWI